MGRTRKGADLQSVASLPEIAALAEGADHVDVKTVACDKELGRFTADLLSYRPGWMRALFRLRGVLAGLFGLRRESGGRGERLSEVSFTPGAKAAFFTVTAAVKGRYWIAEASDRHLTAYVAVCAGSGEAGESLRHVATIVRYRHWTGPVYFTIILPFHHLIVAAMARHAAKG
jgi:hypothetical protein